MRWSLGSRRQNTGDQYLRTPMEGNWRANGSQVLHSETILAQHSHIGAYFHQPTNHMPSLKRQQSILMIHPAQAIYLPTMDFTEIAILTYLPATSIQVPARCVRLPSDRGLDLGPLPILTPQPHHRPQLISRGWGNEISDAPNRPHSHLGRHNTHTLPTPPTFGVDLRIGG